MKNPGLWFGGGWAGRNQRRSGGRAIDRNTRGSKRGEERTGSERGANEGERKSERVGE